MTAITLRLVKGSPLSYQEVDDNFSNLNIAKLETVDVQATQYSGNVVLTTDSQSGPVAVISSATSSVAGVLSSADKIYIDSLPSLLGGKANLTHTHSLVDLTDFQVTSPTNSQVLKYNSGSGKWVNSVDNDTTYTAGNGLGLAGTVFSLATPGSLNTTSTNSVTSSGHTHAITFPVTSVAGKTGAVVLETLTRGTYLTGSNYNGSAATTWAVDATSGNTANKVVARDANGNFSAGTATLGAIVVDGVLRDYATATTTATSSVALVSFAAASYGSGEVTIHATQGTTRHLTKLLIAHDGTTAIATEYGELRTGVSLFTVEVDIAAGNVRVLVIPSSTTSTVFKATYTLIGA